MRFRRRKVEVILGTTEARKCLWNPPDEVWVKILEPRLTRSRLQPPYDPPYYLMDSVLDLGNRLRPLMQATSDDP